MEVQMRTADVNGIRLRYAICGKGDSLVLLHGFGQDWFSWNRLLPELALRYTVLMPDLRGLGDEVLPGATYDKKTMASDIQALVRELDFGPIYLVGHDIGLMVGGSSFPGPWRLI
jgi:pimeloyl-ACP methyl ester carboxylesterase